MKNIQSKPRVLVLAPFFLPGFKGGGPIKTVMNLIEHLNINFDFDVLTSDRDLGDLIPYEGVFPGKWCEVGGFSVFYSQTGRRGYNEIFNILCNKKYDLIYLNSFFSFRYAIFPLVAAFLLRKKVIIAPRGEFSVGALSIKANKKLLYLKIFKILRLHKFPIFQASTKFESADIHKVFSNSLDIFEASDVNIFEAENIGSKKFAHNINISTSTRLKVVFLSRISPKKNLLAALEILSNVSNSIEFHIYGPIEDKVYWEQCQFFIKKLPHHIIVSYEGSLLPENVVPTLSKYDVFLLPTFGENYGHVIAEALCAGLPILISDTTPWRNLEKIGIGWDLPLKNLNSFAGILDSLAICSPEKIHEMKTSVMVWAKNKFCQQDAVQANIDMFRYALEKNRIYK